VLLARISMDDSRKITKFRKKWNLHKKHLNFKKLSSYAKDRIERTQMKMVSRFYFIRKVLTRTLYAWRQNVKADAFNRANEDVNQKKTLEECFFALKKHYYGRKMLKNVIMSKQVHLCKSIIQKWAGYAFFRRRG
jgi:hypothetical protein